MNLNDPELHAAAVRGAPGLVGAVISLKWLIAPTAAQRVGNVLAGCLIAWYVAPMLFSFIPKSLTPEDVDTAKGAVRFLVGMLGVILSNLGVQTLGAIKFGEIASKALESWTIRKGDPK